MKDFHTLTENQVRAQSKKIQIYGGLPSVLIDEYPRNSRVSPIARYMANSLGQSEEQQIDITCPFTLQELGLSNYPTKQEFDELIKSKFPFFCKLPQRTGVDLRFQDDKQPLNDWYTVYSDTMADPGGDPHLFRLERNEDGPWLNGDWASPPYRLDPGHAFVFGLR